MLVQHLHVAHQVAFLGEFLLAVHATKHFFFQMASHVIKKLDQINEGTTAWGQRGRRPESAFNHAVVRLVAIRSAEIEKEIILVRSLRLGMAQKLRIQVMTVNN